MTGEKLNELAEALKNAGWAVKRIEEEAYSTYDRPKSGEKYTGEFILKIRPIEEEAADAERIRLRQKAENDEREAEKINRLWDREMARSKGVAV